MLNDFKATKRRIIRVFLSSTFIDMKAEREMLVTQLFPRLREAFRAKGLELVEVDLRWGITKEQSEKGETIKICLEELDDTWPFFVGMIGERYGWMPTIEDFDKIKDTLEAQEFVLEKIKSQRSITEMEFCYAALDTSHLENTFFFIKDESTYNASYKDKVGTLAYDNKMRLIDRLKNQSDYTVMDYTNVQELADKLEMMLRSRIDSLYKEASLTYNHIINRIHAEYGKRALFGYEPSKKLIKTLTENLIENHQSVVIGGPSGSGKTALIAAFLNTIPKAIAQTTHIIYHFVGATREAYTVSDLLKRFIIDFAENLSLEIDFDDLDKTEYTDIFLHLLHELCKVKTRVLIVIDGAEYLTPFPGIRSFGWLGIRQAPSNAVFLMSDRRKNADAIAEFMPLNALPLELLDEDAINRYVPKYLRIFGKSVSESMLKSIAKAFSQKTPATLKAFLDTIRRFGIYELLDEEVQAFTKTTDMVAFYTRILERFERDYDVNHPGLVKKVTSAIVGTKFGLLEDEILAFTGVPPMYFVRFFAALKPMLDIANGYYRVTCVDLSTAIKQRYASPPHDGPSLFKDLADYFFHRIQNDDDNHRYMFELALSLIHSSSTTHHLRFLNIFSDAYIFKVLFETNPTLFSSYWDEFKKSDLPTLFEDKQNRYFKEESIGIVDQMDYRHQLLRFYCMNGYTLDAMKLAMDMLDKQETYLEQGGYAIVMIETAVYLGECYNEIGQPQHAMTLFKAMLNDAFELPFSWNRERLIGRLYEAYAQGAMQEEDYENAQICINEAIETVDNVDDADWLARLTMQKAIILLRLNKYEESIDTYNQSIDIQRLRCGESTESTHLYLETMANFALLRHNINEAIHYLKEALHQFDIHHEFVRIHKRKAELNNRLHHIYSLIGDQTNAEKHREKSEYIMAFYENSSQ